MKIVFTLYPILISREKVKSIRPETEAKSNLQSKSWIINDFSRQKNIYSSKSNHLKIFLFAKCQFGGNQQFLTAFFIA